MPNKITVADALLKELDDRGRYRLESSAFITFLYYDALERHGGFRVVTARHEGAVVNMADAYSESQENWASR
jgi:hypothetical protein